MPVPVTPPRFFASGVAFRAWLEKHHTRSAGLLVGFHRKASGRGGLGYPEARDAALCFGWIDGHRKGIDAGTYSMRFSPRRRGSIWSRVNIRRVGDLKALGLMAPAGLAAFEHRDPAKSGLHSFEAPPKAFAKDERARFRGYAKAWAFFEAQPPGWRRTITHWVVSARRPETRAFRLAALIEHSARGVRVSLLKPPAMPKRG